MPEADEPDPEVSLVVPALNEELTIAQFVEWCHEGLARAGVRGEILIVDSSDDRTPEIALDHGARVLTTPRRGLGRAYIDALPVIRGDWIIMGDADCTYDFRNLGVFIDGFRQGNEYVMGSRWQGSIEPGSMPWLHQRFGTPVTTWILNRLFDSNFSDIHCGMRGITKDAFQRLNLSSQSWEYASELVLKSVHMGLRTTEVPVTFLKDQEGRVSHHKRIGWLSPFQAAWINLKAMFIYGADFFLVKPGVALLFVGLLLTIPLALGPVTIGGLTLSLFSMLLGLVAASIGLEAYYLGLLARVTYDYAGNYKTRLLSRWSYTRTTLAAGATAITGLGLVTPLFVQFVGGGFTFTSAPTVTLHLAVFGLLFMIAGFETFTFTLLLHALTVPRWTAAPSAPAPNPPAIDVRGRASSSPTSARVVK